MSRLILQRGDEVEFAVWDCELTKQQMKFSVVLEGDCEIWGHYGTFQHWLPDGRTAIIVANNGMVHEIPASRIRLTAITVNDKMDHGL